MDLEGAARMMLTGGGGGGDEDEDGGRGSSDGSDDEDDVIVRISSNESRVADTFRPCVAGGGRKRLVCRSVYIDLPSLDRFSIIVVDRAVCVTVVASYGRTMVHRRYRSHPVCCSQFAC